MKERPILFKAEMIRAILEGRKTMTRRVVKARWIPFVEEMLKVNGKWVFETIDYSLSTPYGKPGNQLWVREAWATSYYCNNRPPRETKNHGLPFWYRSDNEVIFTGAKNGGRSFLTRGKWRASIHMPRWVSRIDLKITDIRVERLQDISESDAEAEGVQFIDHSQYTGQDTWSVEKDNYQISAPNAITSFMRLWDSINGKSEYSWDVNPWVWVVEFERVK